MRAVAILLPAREVNLQMPDAEVINMTNQFFRFCRRRRF